MRSAFGAADTGSARLGTRGLSHTERKLAAILSAHLKGYGLLIAADEETTIGTPKAHREVMCGIIPGHPRRVERLAHRFSDSSPEAGRLYATPVAVGCLGLGVPVSRFRCRADRAALGAVCSPGSARHHGYRRFADIRCHPFGLLGTYTRS